jgi:hypothetical protein
MKIPSKEHFLKHAWHMTYPHAQGTTLIRVGIYGNHLSRTIDSSDDPGISHLPRTTPGMLSPYQTLWTRVP